MPRGYKLTPETIANAQDLWDKGWHIEDIAKECECTSMALRNNLDLSGRKPYQRTAKRVLHNHILTMRW